MILPSDDKQPDDGSGPDWEGFTLCFSACLSYLCVGAELPETYIIVSDPGLLYMMATIKLHNETVHRNGFMASLCLN